MRNNPVSKGAKDLLTPTSLFCLSVKNVTMNRFDGYIQTIHRISHDGDSRFTSRKPKRAGDDGSPVLFRERKITPELEAEP